MSQLQQILSNPPTPDIRISFHTADMNEKKKSGKVLKYIPGRIQELALIGYAAGSLFGVSDAPNHSLQQSNNYINIINKPFSLQRTKPIDDSDLVVESGAFNFINTTPSIISKAKIFHETSILKDLNMEYTVYTTPLMERTEASQMTKRQHVDNGSVKMIGKIRSGGQIIGGQRAHSYADNYHRVISSSPYLSEKKMSGKIRRND